MTFKLFKLLNCGLLLELVSKTSYFNNDLWLDSKLYIAVLVVQGPYDEENSEDTVRRKTIYEGRPKNKIIKLVQEKSKIIIEEVVNVPCTIPGKAVRGNTRQLASI